MKTDDLRRTLDELAGDSPPVDGALVAVTRRARVERIRARTAIAALSAVVIAGAAVGAVQLRSSGKRVSVVNPAPPTQSGNVADLSWTHVHTPETRINRIVTAGDRTFAVGSYGYAASIQELEPDGHATSGFRDTISHRQAAANDLIAFDGALVAVGTDENGAAAWRSTDYGSTWHALSVEQPPTGQPRGPQGPTASQGPTPTAAISRIIALHGALYTFGTPTGGPYPVTNATQCARSVWTSTDGTSFAIAPKSAGCGGTDATAGPAGVVSLDNSIALAAGRPPLPIAVDAYVTAIASDAHGYVAVGYSATNDMQSTSGGIWWSPDGDTWSRVVTSDVPPDRPFRQEAITGVAHIAGGWVAVGWRVHGDNENVNDALLWTSSDGEHWTEDTRDGGTFEQYARAGGIGVTREGLAIWGQANFTGLGVPGNQLGTDSVLWLGSAHRSGPPIGTLEGSLREVGGPAPGFDRGIAGSMDVTAADGTQQKVAIGSSGRFSVLLTPGTYRVVGHSPSYGDGKDDCTTAEPVRVHADTAAHVTLVCSID